jgi:hypothetical protein
LLAAADAAKVFAYHMKSQLPLAVIPHFSHRRRFTPTIQILANPRRNFMAANVLKSSLAYRGLNKIFLAAGSSLTSKYL